MPLFRKISLFMRNLQKIYGLKKNNILHTFLLWQRFFIGRLDTEKILYPLKCIMKFLKTNASLL
jgi:hypothetical protein